jgi:hypothetical protein
MFVIASVTPAVYGALLCSEELEHFMAESDAEPESRCGGLPHAFSSSGHARKAQVW